MQKRKSSAIRFQGVDERSTGWVMIAKRFSFCDTDVKFQYLKIVNSTLSWICCHSSNFIVLIQYSTCTSFPDQFLNVNPYKFSERIPNPIQVCERTLLDTWL